MVYYEAEHIHRLMAMASKHELHVELALHSPYLPDLAPSDFYFFTMPKKVLLETGFG